MNTKNRIQRSALVLAFAASTLALSACQNLSSPTVRFDRQVNYGDAKAVELVTNEFGSTDLQMIAEKMVDDMLASGAVAQLGAGGKRPILFVDRIK